MSALYEIVSRVLEIPLDQVKSELSRETTTQWDSFNHLMLISEIEKELGVTFPLSGIEDINTVADLERFVQNT